MYILGINSVYHDSSVCLLRDGKLLWFVEEERLSRQKHAKPATIENSNVLPELALTWVLEKEGLSLSAIDHISFSFQPESRLAKMSGSPLSSEKSWGSIDGEERLYRNLKEIPKILVDRGFRGDFHWVSHHLAHAASAYYPSRFHHAAVLVIDGIGEGDSAAIYMGKDSKLTLMHRLPYPSSLGFLWEKFCKFLGFSEYHACKVMGMAAYGNPSCYREAMSLIAKIDDSKGFILDGNILSFRREDYSGLENLFAFKRRLNSEPLEQRHFDLASTLQEYTQNAVKSLAKIAQTLTGSKDLCLAGGVALNCVANRLMFESSDFEDIYIAPASNDAGTALGSALHIWHQLFSLDGSREEHISAYFGPEFDHRSLESTLNSSGLLYQRFENIEAEVAKHIANDKIVAWFQGKMECGPRALGNRSLLANPANRQIREIMNHKVKHRESFRPFSPSILAEHAEEWFEIKKKTYASDFMLLTYPAHEHRRDLIPAVLHEDGTGRVQTVRSETNLAYYKLIDEFRKLTGIPMVLNTSFNDDEPIVCTPEDAIHTFCKTHIDYLALGPFLVSRLDNPSLNHIKK